MPRDGTEPGAHESLARMARELYGTNWIKLEVVGDEHTLQPDPWELLTAAERLVKDGLIPEGEIEDMKAAFQAKLNEEYEIGKNFKPNKADWLDGRWSCAR